jgi:thiol-disulfide isomerase/thioredoxin
MSSASTASIWRQRCCRGLSLGLSALVALDVAVPDSSAMRGTTLDRVTDRGAAGRLETLLINGGGNPGSNFQSHLLNVRELVDTLRNGGVPDSRISVLASDGEDPGLDLALREVQPEDDFWLLTGTPLERHFRTPTTFESSAVPGLRLQPATAETLESWFARASRRLPPGSTLLLYVTDHGTKNTRNTRDNAITLWGKGESASVSQLERRLGQLDPEVRVVSLMSQCYSGSFSNLAFSPGRLPSGRVCGYFSTTAERPAHGCYPEDRGAENIGHSFDFLQELAHSGSFRNAHLHVLRQDVTPDVPVRTSDLFLDELLAEVAARRGQGLTPIADGLLAQAWKSPAAWEPEIRLLDAIGQQFGTFSPRSLGEIEEQVQRLEGLSRQLRTHAQAWTASLKDANRANVGRFLASGAGWAERVDDATLQDLEAEETRVLASLFLADLAAYARTEGGMSQRLRALHQKSKRAAAAAYRMDVRLAVLLRMRTILITVAGRVYLATLGTIEERSAYESLLACEDLRLPVSTPAGQTIAERSPFPALEEDLATARDVLPAWLGIRFRPAPAGLQSTRHLTQGAASVMAVYPDSPALDAGLEIDDVVLGPPSKPFEDPGEIREWTMLADVDVPTPLKVLRGDDELQLTIVPRPYPTKWPELPGPPRVSQVAPALNSLGLRPYSGPPPGEIGEGTPRLLFFWATWCGPCKASLPELMAFERERGTPVIAITDEEQEALDEFFGEFGRPFPERVARDEARRAFRAYGVSGTPTFVLIDGEGVIRSYSTGYSGRKSLGVDGWRWSGSIDAVRRGRPER